MFDKAIKWIMALSGVLTLTMLYAAIAPGAAVQSMFGEAVSGGAAEIIVRNWGILIGLMGAVLIYGAFHPPSRTLALLAAGTSKVAFIALVLSHGTKYLSGLGIAVAIDATCVIIFALYLLMRRRAS
jgi:hypothetical protein